LYYHYGKFDAKEFYPLGTDFTMFGLPGIFYVAPISLGLITAGLFLLLTKTKFGVAMRASVENPGLARVLGINVEKVYTFAWFLAGGLAAMAGTFYPILLPATVNEGSVVIVDIFASSVLGGLSSIYGAMVGGLIIGVSEVLVTAVGVDLIGSWVSLYQLGIPLIIMVITLLFLPQGIVSVKWRSLPRNLSVNWRRLLRFARRD
jgi:branched-chain amino acid transport system permease protein